MKNLRWLKSVCVEIIFYLMNNIVTNFPSHIIRKFFYRHIMNFKIGNKSYIFMGVTFDTRSNFKIGNNSVVNKNCRLDNRGGLFIGSNVSISEDVQILTADHDHQSIKFEGRTNSVTICDYVFIGTRAIILPGVILGKGCIVCAGAVVTKSVGKNEMVAGVPARTIKKRIENYNYTVNYCRLFH
jgi:acetyltransferase-like isoleucine patch superfamily enzyme